MEEGRVSSPSEISSTQADDASKNTSLVAEPRHRKGDVSNLSSYVSRMKAQRILRVPAESPDGAANTQYVASKAVCAEAAQSISVQAGTTGCQFVENLNKLCSLQIVNDRCSLQTYTSHLQSVQTINDQELTGTSHLQSVQTTNDQGSTGTSHMQSVHTTNDQGSTGTSHLQSVQTTNDQRSTGTSHMQSVQTTNDQGSTGTKHLRSVQTINDQGSTGTSHMQSVQTTNEQGSTGTSHLQSVQTTNDLGSTGTSHMQSVQTTNDLGSTGTSHMQSVKTTNDLGSTGTSHMQSVQTTNDLGSTGTSHMQSVQTTNDLGSTGTSHMQPVQNTTKQGSAGELRYTHIGSESHSVPESEALPGEVIPKTCHMPLASVETPQGKVVTYEAPETGLGPTRVGLVEKLPEAYATMTPEAIAAVYSAELYATQVKQEGSYPSDEREAHAVTGGHPNSYTDHVYESTAGDGQSSLDLTYSMYEQTLAKSEETISRAPPEYDARYYYPPVSSSIGQSVGMARSGHQTGYAKFTQPSNTGVDLSTMVASSVASGSEMELSLDETLSEIRAASYAYGQIARSLNRDTSSAPPAQASEYDYPQAYSQLARRLSQESFVTLAPTTLSSQYPYSTESDFTVNEAITTVSQNMQTSYEGCPQNTGPKVITAAHSQITSDCYMYHSPASGSSSAAAVSTLSEMPHSRYSFSKLTSGLNQPGSTDNAVQMSQVLDYSQSAVEVSSNSVSKGMDTRTDCTPTASSYNSSTVPNYGYPVMTRTGVRVTSSASNPLSMPEAEHVTGTKLEMTANQSYSAYALVSNYDYSGTAVSSSKQRTISDSVERVQSGDTNQSTSAVSRHFSDNSPIEQQSSFGYENATANSSSTSLETSDSSYSYSHDSSSTNQDDSVLNESADTPELESAYYPETSTPIDLFHNYAMLTQSVAGSGLSSMAYEHVNAVDHSYYTALQMKATPLYADKTNETQDERYDDELHLGMPNLSEGSGLYHGATDYTGYSAANYSDYGSDTKDRGQAYSYQERGNHAQSEAADSQYQFQYSATPNDPATLDKENYAQLVQAGLATSTYIPEKHAEVNHNLKDNTTLYSNSSKMATPKIESTTFIENAQSQFSKPPSGQRTSLPQIGTLVQLNSLKDNALYFTPDGIRRNILPRFSSFAQSSNTFHSMNDIKGPLKDYLPCSLTSQLPNVKKTEQISDLSQSSSATYNSLDTTPVHFVKVERREETSTDQNQLKTNHKISKFADATQSTVTERLSPLLRPVEITNRPQVKDSARGRTSRTVSAAAGSAAQLPKGGASTSMKRSDLPRPSGSARSHGNLTARQTRRRKSEDFTAKECEKRKKTEIVTCEPDSTQQGDPPEAKLRSAYVSQATREKHARGFYVHLPTRLQIFKPTPDDSNEISSTVEVCVSPVFGLPGIGEEEQVSSGSGVSGVAITSHVAMATASCCTVAKEADVAVVSTVTMEPAVAVESTCAEDNIDNSSVAIGHHGVAMETAVANDNVACGKRKWVTSAAGTNRDYEEPVPLPAEEVLKRMPGPTKDTKEQECLPAISRKPELGRKEEERSVQTTKPEVHHEQQTASQTSSSRPSGATLASNKNSVAPPKKRGRPRKVSQSPSRETRKENVGQEHEPVIADDMVPRLTNTPKTKRKAGRPKKIERTLADMPDVSVERDKLPVRHNLRELVAEGADTKKSDVVPLAGFCGLVAASQKPQNPIMLPSELTEEGKDVDEGASKIRKRKLRNGEDDEVTYKVRKQKLAGRNDLEGAVKTRKQTLADRHDRDTLARNSKTLKKSAVWDGKGHESNVEILDLRLEVDMRELPQIKKKFPRKRMPEKMDQTQSEADRKYIDEADKMIKLSAGAAADNLESSVKAEGNDKACESSLEKVVVEKTSVETPGDVRGVILKPCGRPPKKKVTVVKTAKSKVELNEGEVGKKKRGRPKTPEDKIVDPGSVIPDSAVPDWVVQKSMRSGKYNSYNYQQKEDLLKLAEKFGGRAVASKLNIPVSTISCWKRTFKKDANRDPMSGRKIGSGRKLCYGNEVDELILQWILECRDLHCPTTVDDIGNYAGKIVRQVDGCESFKASHGWVAKFRKRHVAMLDGRTPMSQKLPPKLENLITQFQRQIHEIRQEYSIDPSLIINMDEVPIYFDLTGKKMKSSVKQKQEVVVRVTIGRKQHLTLLGAVTSEGKGLKPMLVIKGKSDVDVEPPSHCILEVTEKGNVDQSIMVEWIQRVLLPYTHGRPSLLVIDSYEPHRVEFIMDLFSKYNVIVAVIPEGCNSRLQPMSISVCKLFRSHLKESWFHTVKEAVSKLANAPSAHWTVEEVESIAKWVVKGWDKIWRDNVDIIKKSFKVCGISNAVDGSEASLIRNDSYLDVTSYCQEQDHDKAHGFWY